MEEGDMRLVLCSKKKGCGDQICSRKIRRKLPMFCVTKHLVQSY